MCQALALSIGQGAGLAITLTVPVILGSNSVEAKQLRVVATIKPVHALAAQVLDGIASPRLLIDGATSPHTYALKPSDAAALQHADLFVRIGPTLEPFSEKIRKALPTSVGVLTLMSAKGLETLSVRASGTFEAHDHDHEPHGAGDDHHASAQKNVDPHIWLDPHNATAIVRAIQTALIAIAPEHATKLKANSDRAVARLNRLEAELQQQLERVHTVPYIVFHDAFHYFENRFGLTAVGALTLHPEAPPSAKRLNEIRHKLSEARVKCVFSEPQFNARRIKSVVEGTAVKTGTLDPLGVDVPAGQDAYDVILRSLARRFIACVSG